MAKKKAAKKPAAKKPPAKKKTIAKKPATKTFSAKKPAAKKPGAAKKVAPKKPKAPGKKVKKPKALSNVALLAGGPRITSPANGDTVPANTDLVVTIATRDVGSAHTIELIDTSTNTVVDTQTVTPATSPFNVTIPGSALAPNGRYTIKVTSPGGSNSITIATGP